jgi:glutaminyl-tRNA synthetase
LRRRGYTPDGINNFCRDVGFSRNENVIEFSRFEYHQRNALNSSSRRATAVTGVPIQIVLTNWPKDKVEFIEMKNHPKDVSYGKRTLALSNIVWINSSDFREIDSKDFFGLALNKEVKLKMAYNITCTEIVERDAHNNIIKLSATVDFNNTNKCKPLTWLSNNELGQKPRTAEVRIYNHLFTCPVPGFNAKIAAKERMSKRQKELMDGGMEASAAIIICTDEEDALWEGKPAAWLDDITPNSLEVTTHMFDSSVFEFADKPFTTFQMERVGYYVVDPDSTKEHMVLNRTCPLRERKGIKSMKNNK